MIDLKLIADEIANTVIDSNIVDQKQLSAKVKTLLELLLDRSNFGPQLKVALNKNKNHRIAIERQEIARKYWHDELKKVLSNSEMQSHYNKLNVLINEFEKSITH